MSEGALVGLVFVGVLAVIVGIGLLAWHLERKRREALAQLAAEQGFVYQRTGTGQLTGLADFRLFTRGRNPRSAHHLVGSDADSGLQVVIADFSYTTGSGKNASTTTQTICVLAHPLLALPACLLRRQVAFFDALGKWFGGNDYDFDDDPEFSRRFILQGEDEEAVRAAFAPEVRAWCGQQEGNLQVECAGNAILVHYGRRLKPEQIPDLLRTASALMAQWLRPPWLLAPNDDPDDDAPDS